VKIYLKYKFKTILLTNSKRNRQRKIDLVFNKKMNFFFNNKKADFLKLKKEFFKLNRKYAWFKKK